MGILKMTAYRAEAEVLGRLVEVHFDEEVGLTFHGLNMEEAGEIIDRAANKQLQAVRPVSNLSAPKKEVEPEAPKKAFLPVPPPRPELEKQEKQQEVEVRVGSPSAPPPAPPAAEPKKGRAKREPANTAAALDAAKVPEAAQPAEPIVEQPAAPAAPVPAPAVAVPPAPLAPPAPPPAVAAPEGMADLTKATALKDVVGILYDHFKISDADGMVAKCEELRQSVPVLSRITPDTLGNRVRRVMEMITSAPA